MKCGWSWSLICCKNLKDYYSRKCTLNQSKEKVLQFFHNKWHEKCSNFKIYIWFFYRKRWFKWLFLTSIDRKGSYISDVWWISFYECLKLKIFIFCIRVTKFYTFSWNCSYTTLAKTDRNSVICTKCAIHQNWSKMFLWQFWRVLMTIKCDVIIDLVVCGPLCVKILLWTLTIVHMFDFLIFDF